MSDVEKITCPYNKAHEIIPERFQSHLYKCRENYPSTEYKPCKWNSCHDVPMPEYQYHLTVCPDRKKVDTAKFHIGEVHEKRLAPDMPDIALPPSSNEWDDVDMPSYLDVKEQVLEKKEVLRIPVGSTKSKKRDFYQHEHNRFDNISKGEEPEPSISLSGGRGISKKSQAPPPGLGLGMGRGAVRDPPVRNDPGRRREAPTSSALSSNEWPPLGGARALSPQSNAGIKKEKLSDDERLQNEDDDDDDDFQIVIHHHKGLGRGRRKH